MFGSVRLEPRAEHSSNRRLSSRSDSATSGFLSDSILRIARETNSTLHANGCLAVQVTPDQILAALSLEFADDWKAPQIEESGIEIERKIRAARPEVVNLFIKPQTPATFQDRASRRSGSRPPQY